jgi:hypothetical protein
MLCLSSRNMIDKTMCEVLWRNISDFYVDLRVEVGKHSHVILAMYFLSWTRIMSVLIGWPIWNTLTPHGKKMHVKQIYVIFIHLIDSGILLIIDLNKIKGEKGGGILFVNFTVRQMLCFDSLKRNVLRLKLKSAL